LLLFLIIAFLCLPSNFSLLQHVKAENKAFIECLEKVQDVFVLQKLSLGLLVIYKNGGYQYFVYEIAKLSFIFLFGG